MSSTYPIPKLWGNECFLRRLIDTSGLKRVEIEGLRGNNGDTFSHKSVLSFTESLMIS
jgi:hypothetical protein